MVVNAIESAWGSGVKRSSRGSAFVANFENPHVRVVIRQVMRPRLDASPRARLRRGLAVGIRQMEGARDMTDTTGTSASQQLAIFVTVTPNTGYVVGAQSIPNNLNGARPRQIAGANRP